MVVNVPGSGAGVAVAGSSGRNDHVGRSKGRRSSKWQASLKVGRSVY